MSNHQRDCEHGSLKRACEICDKDEQIANLTARLAEWEKAIDSWMVCNWIGVYDEKIGVSKTLALALEKALDVERDELRGEVENLKHDIERHIAIASSEATARQAAEARLAAATSYLCGILSIDLDAPDCVDNHGETYQSQGLADWGKAQLAEFSDALAKSAE